MKDLLSYYYKLLVPEGYSIPASYQKEFGELMKEGKIVRIPISNIENLAEDYKWFAEKETGELPDEKEIHVAPFAYYSHKMNADLLLPDTPEFREIKRDADEIIEM